MEWVWGVVTVTHYIGNLMQKTKTQGKNPKKVRSGSSLGGFMQLQYLWGLPREKNSKKRWVILTDLLLLF